MLVLTAVSSMKTRRVESSDPCSRIQRRRARATSARSCSHACRTFFERDAVTLQKSKQSRPAAGYLPLVHRSDNLVERPITLLLDKGDNLFDMVFQRRAAAAVGLGAASPLVAPRLMPPHRRADADTKVFRRLVPCRSFVNCLHHTFAQIRRIRSCHGSPKGESPRKTLPFRPSWESRFRSNGNRSSGTTLPSTTTDATTALRPEADVARRASCRGSRARCAG
jgi:hypothetical protein